MIAAAATQATRVITPDDLDSEMPISDLQGPFFLANHDPILSLTNSLLGTVTPDKCNFFEAFRLVTPATARGINVTGPRSDLEVCELGSPAFSFDIVQTDKVLPAGSLLLKALKPEGEKQVYFAMAPDEELLQNMWRTTLCEISDDQDWNVFRGHIHSTHHARVTQESMLSRKFDQEQVGTHMEDVRLQHELGLICNIADPYMP